MNDKKVILITGGASGLGEIIAKRFVSKGHIVYCTSRNIKSLKVDGVNFIELDITSDFRCQYVISKIIENEKRIDVIVNNAGITLSGPTLDFSVDDFKKILDTNVVGSFRLIKALCLHTPKPGLVVNITSLNGFLSFPNFGLYSASKFSMEALGLALRYELAPTTKVVNVAIGALISELSKKMPHKTAREKSLLLKWLLPLTDPVNVSIVLDKLINAPSVPARVLIGRDAHIVNILQKMLPSYFFDKIIFYIWNKK